MTTANLTSWILSLAQQRRGAPCLRFMRLGVVHELSWATFGDEVAAVLVGLDALALSHGARLAILAKNRWEWLALDLAASGRGVATVSLDPGWSDNMLARVMNHAKVEAIVVEGTAELPRARAMLARVPTLRSIATIDDSGDDVPSLATLAQKGRTADPGRLDELMSSVGSSDLATIMFTGGSTGEPKGVLRTQRNALSRGWGWFPWMGDAARPDPAPDDVLLDPLSFCHSAGRWWAQMALTRGAVLALPESEEPTLREFELLQPTHLAAVPRVVLGLHKALHGSRADVAQSLGGRLRCIVSGGAALAGEIRAFFEDAGIEVRIGYGGTEIGIIAIQTATAPRGTVGVPTGAEVQIVDGEILVRGPGVTPGYLANVDATMSAQAGDGWWRTGDRGTLDGAGNLAISGRVRAAFNCYEGTNIDPTEIEQLLESEPFVREAVIVGHRRPFIVALVVPDHEALAREAPGDAEAFVRARIDRINETLEDFERVRRLCFVDPARMALVRTVTVAKKVRIDREEIERVFAEQIASLYDQTPAAVYSSSTSSA